MNKILPLFILLFSYLNIIQGQYFYIPDNDINAVQTKDLNDLQISIAAPLKNRVNIQLAYSPINFISLSVAYFKHHQKEGTSSFVSSNTKGHSYTGAIGVYRFLNKLEKHDFFLTKNMDGVLLYANIGYSKGYISNVLNELYEVNLSHQNIFFRSGISLNYRILSLSYSTRYLALDFQKGDITGDISQINWFISRLEKDVEEVDPRNLKESLFRIKLTAKRFDIYTDFNTIRYKKNRNFRSSLYIFSTYNLGLIVKLDQLFGLK